MIVTVREDLTSNVTTDDSLLECELPNYNPETLVPFADEAEVQAFIATSLTDNYFMPKLSDEEKQAAKDAAAITVNTARAKAGLLDTDWCENASVRNTDFTPHLTNGDEFDAYRLQLRAIMVNKVVSVESWPEQPVGVWST